MKEKFLNVIGKENIKNPYTDSEIAKLLNVKRETITSLRNDLGIPNSMERRKNTLIDLVNKILKDDKDISERELTKKVNDLGFNVSRHTIRECKKELEETKDKMKDVYLKESEDDNEDQETYKEVLAFEKIIGSKGSLKPYVQQAKAAMMYPPYGLHTLILGPTGVGKSELAQAMYNFGRETKKIDSDSVFIVFNCADYADNPQLLMSQLFGYVKGAFTGADEGKEGLVEKANGGVLFLDEVHRLPPEGQEILFYLIDKGKFRRLGETDAEREVNLMIIAATTENPDSTLLDSFRRRIPMTIELPSLALRSLDERLEMIKEFLRRETNRTKNSIRITNDALKALLLYDCPGNIGQLRSDIQVSCARSFLNHVVNQTNIMEITIEELPISAKKGLLKIQNNRLETEKLIGVGDLIIYVDNKPIESTPKENLYILPNEIYSYIEERYIELQNERMNQDLINYIIGSEMEEKLEKLMSKVKENIKPIDKKDLANIVGIQVIDIVEKITRIAKWKLGINEENLYYVLATHLSATIERVKKGIIIRNPQLDKIKKDYNKEFIVAKEMVNIIEEELDVELTEDEAGFITMYLRLTMEEESKIEGRVGVVLISHGNVACGMGEVANKLLGVNHAKAIEMSLDESPELALKRATDLVKSVDEGKGVLLMVDMGSLATFGELITKSTGIKTRTVSRTDTVMVIEAVRRCILPEANLDQIADSLEKEPKQRGRINKKNNLGKPKIILTICITGQGSAKKVKKLVSNITNQYDEQITIIPIGAMDENIQSIIESIQRDNEIIAVVGTVNPKIQGVPYISLEDIINGVAEEKLKIIIDVQEQNNGAYYYNINTILDADTTIFNMDVADKKEAIERLGSLLYEQGYVNDNFINATIEREELGPSFLREGVAIPHADPSFVIKPKIALGLLKNPIDWNGNEIKIVLLLAINNECIDLIRELKRFFEDDDNYINILNAENYNAVRQVLGR